MRQSELLSNVVYIQGSPMIEKDLRRCQADRAKSIVLLANKQAEDPTEEDSRIVFQAITIITYLEKFDSKAGLIIQLLKPESKVHYYLSTNQRKARQDQVVCVEEVKLSLMAKSCLCPGLVAVIANLISSSGSPPVDLPKEWLNEYWQGKEYEIYRVSVAQRYAHWEFSKFAHSVYKNDRAIVIALELGSGDFPRVIPNPGNYQLPSNTSGLSVYVIAPDVDIAQRISRREDLKSGRTGIQTQNFSLSSKFALNDGGNDDEENVKPEPKSKFTKNVKGGDISGLEEKCHLAGSKVNVADITYKTLHNNILAENHIIICGIVPHMINFVMPLRAKYLSRIIPIVILNTEVPTEKIWHQISFFPEIYFIKGSALNEHDLDRANVKK